MANRLFLGETSAFFAMGIMSSMPMAMRVPFWAAIFHESDC